MAPSDKEAKAHWAAYLKAKLNAKRWDAVRLVTQTGDDLTYKSVNNWLAARAIPDPEAVVVVAEALDLDLAEALQAANRPRLAEQFAKRRPLPAGVEPEPVDEGIRILLGRKDRTDEQLADAVDMYQKRKDRLVAEMLKILDAMDEPNGRADVA